MAVLPLPPEDFARLALWRRVAIRVLVHPVTYFIVFAGIMLIIRFVITNVYRSYGAWAVPIAAIAIVLILANFTSVLSRR